MNGHVRNKIWIHTHTRIHTFANLDDKTGVIEMKSKFERCFHSQTTACNSNNNQKKREKKTAAIHSCIVFYFTNE